MGLDMVLELAGDWVCPLFQALTGTWSLVARLVGAELDVREVLEADHHGRLFHQRTEEQPLLRLLHVLHGSSSQALKGREAVKNSQ